MKVTARVQRSDGWWAIEVLEVPGVFTQTRRLDQVADMVADAIRLFTGNNELPVEVTLEVPRDPEVMAALQARQAAEEASSAASQAMRATVSTLLAEGLTVRDVAYLLEISPQRVSQLTKNAA